MSQDAAQKPIRQHVTDSLNEIRLGASQLPEPGRSVRHLTADIVEPMMLRFAADVEELGRVRGAVQATWMVSLATSNALMSFCATVTGGQGKDAEALAKLMLQQISENVEGMATREFPFKAVHEWTR
jgi:hypothetical protein